MCRFFNRRTWAVLSLIWISAVAYVGWTSWPHLPLDVSSGDPATHAAFRSAEMRHLMVHAAVALGLPVLAYLAGSLACRLGRR